MHLLKKMRTPLDLTFPIFLEHWEPTVRAGVRKFSKNMGATTKL